MILTEKLLTELLAEHDAATIPEALAEWHEKNQAIITYMGQSDTWSSFEAIGRFLDAMQLAILEAKGRAAVAA